MEVVHILGEVILIAAVHTVVEVVIQEAHTQAVHTVAEIAEEAIVAEDQQAEMLVGQQLAAEVLQVV